MPQIVDSNVINPDFAARSAEGVGKHSTAHNMAGGIGKHPPSGGRVMLEVVGEFIGKESRQRDDPRLVALRGSEHVGWADLCVSLHDAHAAPHEIEVFKPQGSSLPNPKARPPEEQDQRPIPVGANGVGHVVQLPRREKGHFPTLYAWDLHAPCRVAPNHAGVLSRLADAFGVSNPRPEQLARAEGLLGDALRKLFRVAHTSATKDVTLKLERLAKERGDEELCRKLRAIRRGQNRDLAKMREEQ
jgi:hypothetical protein